MIGIYKITNPKNKVYIGKTTNWEKRKYYYTSSWKWIKQQRKLYNSIKKYGVENHTFELFYPTTKSQLNEQEVFWIKHFNAVEKGLNIKYGGQGGKLTQETKDNIAKALMGKKQSKETIEKRAKSLKGQKRSEYTKKLMSEAKEGFEITWGDKISEAKLANPYSPTQEARNNVSKANSKAILQYDTKGNFIKEYPSAIQAEKETHVKRDNISHALRGKTKSAGGFIWKFKKQEYGF
jgi:group I intron endonuclease